MCHHVFVIGVKGFVGMSFNCLINTIKHALCHLIVSIGVMLIVRMSFNCLINTINHALCHLIVSIGVMLIVRMSFSSLIYTIYQLIRYRIVVLGVLLIVRAGFNRLIHAINHFFHYFDDMVINHLCETIALQGIHKFNIGLVFYQLLHFPDWLFIEEVHLAEGVTQSPLNLHALYLQHVL